MSTKKRAEVIGDRFKTKICAKWLESGVCPYDTRCMFAHGEHELRTSDMNAKDGLTTEEAVWKFKKTNPSLPISKQQSSQLKPPLNAAATPSQQPPTVQPVTHQHQLRRSEDRPLLSPMPASDHSSQAQSPLALASRSFADDAEETSIVLAESVLGNTEPAERESDSTGSGSNHTAHSFAVDTDQVKGSDIHNRMTLLTPLQNASVGSGRPSFEDANQQGGHGPVFTAQSTTNFGAVGTPTGPGKVGGTPSSNGSSHTTSPLFLQPHHSGPTTLALQPAANSMHNVAPPPHSPFVAPQQQPAPAYHQPQVSQAGPPPSDDRRSNFHSMPMYQQGHAPPQVMLQGAGGPGHQANTMSYIQVNPQGMMMMPVGAQHPQQPYTVISQNQGGGAVPQTMYWPGTLPSAPGGRM